MTDDYYQGYLAGYANLEGRSSSPEWLAAYDRAREDNAKSVVNEEVYYRFFKEVGETPLRTQEDQ